MHNAVDGYILISKDRHRDDAYYVFTGADLATEKFYELANDLSDAYGGVETDNTAYGNQILAARIEDAGSVALEPIKISTTPKTL